MDKLEKKTITEVAKRAKVSPATVSRFLSNPLSIKEGNRRRVEAAIKEFNYQPSVYARRLAGGKINSYGLILPGYEGIFYSFYAMELIRSVASRLDEKGSDMHLHIFWNKDIFKASLVDGVIFADIIGNEKQLQRVVAEGVPAVVINKKIEDENISCVSVNNFEGAYSATEFLIHHGHKNVVHLAGDLLVECARERVNGYKSALQANGISVREEYIKNIHFSRKEARDVLEELFSLPVADRPTAFFCCSDEVAIEVVYFCAEKGITVPQEISVIGFDDNPLCIYGNLMLTTVRQPLRTMAAMGVDILKEVVEKKSLPQKMVLSPELIIRDTVSFV